MRGRENIKAFGKNIVVVALFVGLTVMSVFSFSSVQVVRGNAHTVNHAGLVRGLGQRLIKWELAGRRNNALESRIDRGGEPRGESYRLGPPGQLEEYL